MNLDVVDTLSPASFKPQITWRRCLLIGNSRAYTGNIMGCKSLHVYERYSLFNYSGKLYMLCWLTSAIFSDQVVKQHLLFRLYCEILNLLLSFHYMQLALGVQYSIVNRFSHIQVFVSQNNLVKLGILIPGARIHITDDAIEGIDLHFSN